MTAPGLVLALATAGEREQVYRLRHETYARELGQHGVNPEGPLTDAIDGRNQYLVVRGPDGLAGFLSVTPPGGAYGLDRHVERGRLPFALDEGVHELRLLTVVPGSRGSEVAALLMSGALRWLEAHGATRVLAMGRREVLAMYRAAGLRTVGLPVRSGAVEFEVLTATMDEVRARTERHARLLERLGRHRSELPLPAPGAVGCFHGGASMAAVGDGFDDLGRRDRVVPADVLDAWFPPAPGVVEALREDLPWLLRTSPPTGSEGAGPGRRRLPRPASRVRPARCRVLGPGVPGAGPLAVGVVARPAAGPDVRRVRPRAGEGGRCPGRPVGAAPAGPLGPGRRAPDRQHLPAFCYIPRPRPTRGKRLLMRFSQ